MSRLIRRLVSDFARRACPIRFQRGSGGNTDALGGSARGCDARLIRVPMSSDEGRIMKRALFTLLLVCGTALADAEEAPKPDSGPPPASSPPVGPAPDTPPAPVILEPIVVVGPKPLSSSSELNIP